MASWRVQRRLAKVASRLRELRAELAVLDEQLLHLDMDAEEQELRSLVSETAGAAAEARDARRHVDVLAKHRAKVAEEIQQLEVKQDELLDQFSAPG